MHSKRPASCTTPARLALITAVGPPDCATNKFPTSSAINHSAFHSRPDLAGRVLYQSPAPCPEAERNLANRWINCQSGILMRNSHVEYFHFSGRFSPALLWHG